MKKAFAWIAINGTMAAMIYLGIEQEVQWALNVFMFFTWVFVILQVFTAMSLEARAKAKELGGPSVPLWVSWSFDCVVMVFLSAHGWFFYAVLILITALAQQATYTDAA